MSQEKGRRASGKRKGVSREKGRRESEKRKGVSREKDRRESGKRRARYPEITIKAKEPWPLWLVGAPYPGMKLLIKCCWLFVLVPPARFLICAKRTWVFYTAIQLWTVAY